MPETKDDAPTPGSVWRYKERDYTVIANGDTKRMKDSGDASWSRAVEYDQIPNNGDAALDFTFVRKEADFLTKFERIR